MEQIKDIESLTIAEAREYLPHARKLLSTFGEALAAHDDILPYPVGTPVYIRTCAYNCVGRIRGSQGRDWIVLSEASYIGTDGRYSEATEKGLQNVQGSELEKVGQGGILKVKFDAIVDVARHIDALPTETK